ncbi:tRNA threonylcarbamoyladenosine biosynthesis protein TsaB [Candidatus Ecksteinia adelgidicola]|nr:tRNA threonylcarbamoyladenosine biosynthesis protein TsaB [Candidatus Ecksteinia adelgidicola]
MSINILAVDTSADFCSVAILNKNKIFSLSKFCPNKHTQYILPMVKQILVNANLTLKKLNVLAFSCGPGNFTGIRISINIIQGLALGANLPVIGVSTLQVLAESVWKINGRDYVLTAIDTRTEGGIYWSEFKRQKNGFWNNEQGEKIFSYNQALKRINSLCGSWTCVGSAWKSYPNLLNKLNLNICHEEIVSSQAESVLSLSLLFWKKGLAITVEQAKLTYLYNDIFWKKLPGR